MWFELDADHGGTATTDVLKFPLGAANARLSTALPLTFPPPLVAGGSAAWTSNRRHGREYLRTLASQKSPEDITVDNALGSGTTIDINSTNNFHVKPTNATAATYEANAVQARLRIADWGSSLVGRIPSGIRCPSSCDKATGPSTPTVGDSAPTSICSAAGR